MIRNNKVKIIISSIVILIPMLAGVILWDSIPDESCHRAAYGVKHGM